MEDKDRLYAAVIGDRSTDYYLEVFQSFDREGKTRPTFNAGAGFGVGLWFLWRKLWLPGLFFLAYAAVAILALIWMSSWMLDLWREASGGFDTSIAIFRFGTLLGVYLIGLGPLILTLDAVFTVPLLLLAAYPPAMGNALYHRYCNRLIDEALRRHKTVGAAEQALVREGGVSHGAVALGVLLLFGMVNFGWSRMNQDQNDAALKSQVVEVHASALPLLNLMAGVFRGLGRWPDRSDGNVGVAVGEKSYYFKNGERRGDYVLLLSGGRHPTAIHYAPLPRPDGRIEWVCTSRGFDAKALPASCRDLR